MSADLIFLFIDWAVEGANLQKKALGQTADLEYNQEKDGKSNEICSATLRDYPPAGR